MEHFKIMVLSALANGDCYKQAPTHHTTSCITTQTSPQYSHLKFRKKIIAIFGKITDLIKIYMIYSKNFLTRAS